MQEIYRMMLERLRSSGVPEVYASFDALPVEKKSRTLFTVLSLQQVDFGESYPIMGGGAYPFTADFRVDLLTPMMVDPQDTARFFFQRIVPAMLGTDCMFLKFDAQSPKIDLRLERMVYGGTFRLHGAFCIGETEESA
ncbi:MAG: hypothetical protein E7504_07350 [Ruminococcus sp.]|nr:hypothetical protein [Ruminococcus sp.]